MESIEQASQFIGSIADENERAADEIEAAAQFLAVLASNQAALGNGERVDIIAAVLADRLERIASQMREFI